MIYILGNYNYQPNYTALLKNISFLKSNNKVINSLFLRNNLRVEIIGYSSESFKNNVNSQLIRFFPENMVYMVGSLNSLKDLHNNGFASLTAVETRYGRQTKEFVSLNNLMPVLKFHNNYKNLDEKYILNFSNIDEFVERINFLMVMKNMVKVKKDIIRSLEQESKNYGDFVDKFLE